MNSLFLDTLKKVPRERPPVWFMRQAGRAMPGYNRLREKYSFREIMETSELAARVTVEPLSELGVDAVILFSDILVIPEALGLEITYTNKGPVIEKTLTLGKDDRLRPNPDKLSPIYEAIRCTGERLPESIPLIGFCGGPLTLLYYMVEGTEGGTKTHAHKLARWFYAAPERTREVLSGITELSIAHASRQVEAGIRAFQMFETWAGLIPYPLYREIVLPLVIKIFDAVRKKNVPVIYFPRGMGLGILDLPLDRMDGLSVDWQAPMKQVVDTLGGKIALQGNLDPRILLDSKNLKTNLSPYLEVVRKCPHWICNLGHGVFPGTHRDTLRRIVDWIKNRN